MKKTHLQWSARTLLAVLWTGTFLLVLARVMKWPLPYGLEPDPMVALLGLISTSITWLVSQVGKFLRGQEEELEAEKFSTPLALAYGYVNNFVEPLVTRLLQQAGRRANDVRLYIYIPGELSELENAAAERTIARMRAKKFDTKVVNLQLEQGRTRDVLTVMRGGANTVYFDFPNTLLTLKTVVDYKVRTPVDGSPEQARRELGAKFIRRFHKAVEQRLEEKHLTEYVKFTNKDLEFLGSEKKEEEKVNR